MEKYRHPQDCYIEREHKDYKASAVLMDCDGEVVRVFDENWTDEQIFAALAFANHAYDKGVTLGQWKKASEIRKALDIA